jgi:adenylosuccinate synthase
MGDQIRNLGNEFGSVTGRPRRCGWFDAPLLRYTAMINGFESTVITKLDVLDELEKVPVCVAYRSGKNRVDEFPATIKELERLEAVYECLPGWQTSTAGISSFSELPSRAKDYVRFLEAQTGVEVGCISTGPERNQTIVVPGSKFEKLFR